LGDGGGGDNLGKLHRGKTHFQLNGRLREKDSRKGTKLKVPKRGEKKNLPKSAGLVGKKKKR